MSPFFGSLAKNVGLSKDGLMDVVPLVGADEGVGDGRSVYCRVGFGSTGGLTCSILQDLPYRHFPSEWNKQTGLWLSVFPGPGVKDCFAGEGGGCAGADVGFPLVAAVLG